MTSFFILLIYLYLGYRYINKLMENAKKISGRSAALINFKKAATLLAKVAEMTEKGDYCIDIMQQNLAAIGLLKSAHWSMMENHFKSCFKTAIDSKNEKRKQEMIEEILKVVKLFNK